MSSITPPLTVQRIISTAYYEAGKIEEDQQPNSAQYARGIARLNDMVNLWQASPGLKLSTMQDISIPLVQGQGKYSLGPSGNVVMIRPMRITMGYYLTSQSIQQPLVMLSYSDYKTLSQPSSLGAINSFMVDKQQFSMNVYVWNVPDSVAATGTLHVIAQNQAAQASSLTDNIALPIEWAMALIWGLADQLTRGQPESIINLCRVRAKEYKEILDNWDVEDASFSIAPDNRAMAYNNSFQ